ncbi:DUF6603 domain-containing protein [Kitasatospora sp. NPDC098652]|uniref:DUF6603 domain-containing protein n=1 Tax=Kitasatospora sp. NPDC098652 TaxID=3364095 RepID=UPI0037F3C57B
MTDSVAELATGLRQALTGVFGTLAGLGSDEQRRQALRTALGELTPGALLGRLTALGADQGGRLLPALVTVLAQAIGQTAPTWHLDVPGALRVDASQVGLLAPALPADLVFALSVGAFRIAPGVEVRDGITLTLTAPADATGAGLVVRIGGLSLSPPGDALLALLLPAGGPLFEGDVTARADAGGVSFDGGGRSGVALPLKSVPPLLKAPSLYLAPRADAVRLTLSFGASVAGLAEATVEGVGAEVAVADGAVTVTPVAADGLGVRLALGPAKGAGYLRHDGDRYAGALALGLGVVDVKAFGVLHTSPFALLAVLSAGFDPPIELGLAFTLNAVGGIVGVGYAIDRDGLAAAVQGGQLDRVLFPADPVAAAPQILTTLDSVFRPRPGSIVVGPMFRLGWGRPVSFLTADIGLVLELPSAVIALLGRLRVALPAPQAPVIDLRAAIVGIVDAAHGLVELTADLGGSRLLLAPIEGGLALRVKSGDDATFILSAGGFHPRFTAPPGFPVPRRLSIAIADSAFVKIVFTGYFAVTPATVQAGASLTAVIGTEDTGVSGRLGFDALVRWEPSFGLVLDLYGSFHLRFAGASLCSVDLKVLVEGPTPCWHVAGRASVSLFLFDVSFPFDEHWGCTGTATAPPPPDVAGRLLQAVTDPRSWAPVPPPDAGALPTVQPDAQGAALLHPVGLLRLSQRVVPLGVPITRFGPGRLPAPPPTFTVAVAFASGSGTSVPVTEQFARADFFDLTDDEKLTQPAFEPLCSGAELAPPAGTGAAPRRSVDMVYQTIVVGGDPAVTPNGWRIEEPALTAALGHGAVALSALYAERTRYTAPGLAPALNAPRYAIADRATLAEAAGAARSATFTEALVSLRGVSKPGTAFQVVAAYELHP